MREGEREREREGLKGKKRVSALRIHREERGGEGTGLTDRAFSSTG